MKNREKYPNTDDALKAWKKHNDETGCPCSFSTWLDRDPDSDDDRLPGLAFAAMGLAMMAGIAKARAKDAAKEKPEESDKPKETDDAECPLCHDKHGRFRAGGLFVDFHCPNCDALIVKKSDVDVPSCASTSAEFKAWFGKFTAAAK